MVFSDPVLARLFERYCVLCTVNVAADDPQDGVSAEDQAWVKQNAPNLTPLLNEGILGPAIVSPDWKTVHRVTTDDLQGRLDSKTKVDDNWMARATENALEASVRAFGIEGGPPLLKPRVPLPRDVQADDLLLRVSSRFLGEGEAQPPVQPRLPRARPFHLLLALHGDDGEIRSNYELRLRHPLATREWVVLKPAQYAALLPPPGRGQWDVDAAVATRLLWLFRPSTQQFFVRPEDVKSIALKATLESPTLVRLEGAVRIRQFWFYTSSAGTWRGDLLVDDYWGESAVSGYLTFDPATRRVKTLRLATDGAVYRGVDETRLPYASVAYSVDASSVEREELSGP